jgi:hypothetical protein
MILRKPFRLYNKNRLAPILRRVLIRGGVLAAIVGALCAAFLIWWQAPTPRQLNVAVVTQANTAAFKAGEPLSFTKSVVLENTSDEPLEGLSVAVEFFPRESAVFKVALPVVTAMPDVLRGETRPEKHGARKVTWHKDELPPAARIILKFSANQDADLRVIAIAKGFELEERILVQFPRKS